MVKKMTGLIMSSPNPQKLALFYRDIMGIPLVLNKHGTFPEHWECDYEGMHYAVLKGRKNECSTQPYVPSFELEDIGMFVSQNNLTMLHPLMDLGCGDFVGSINDVDGNMIRLWMTKNV